MFTIKNYFIGFLFVCSTVQAQEVPAIKLATTNGNVFETQQFNATSNKPIVLAFWATWCIPCINELSAINDSKDSWKEKLQFDFYAIAEDDSRTIKRVLPLVNGKGWDFTVLLDANQDFKRILNIPSIPFTMVIKNGKIIYRHIGYVDGAENELLDIIKKNQ
jgi:thiol-disulfide isomerase/thioredoxin